MNHLVLNYLRRHIASVQLLFLQAISILIEYHMVSVFLNVFVRVITRFTIGWQEITAQ